MSNAKAVRAAQGPELGRGILVILALAVVVGVQGCDRNEPGRPLVYEKGTYQGPVDEQLDQAQIEALRQRAARQQAQF